MSESIHFSFVVEENRSMSGFAVELDCTYQNMTAKEWSEKALTYERKLNATEEQLRQTLITLDETERELDIYKPLYLR